MLLQKRHEESGKDVVSSYFSRRHNLAAKASSSSECYRLPSPSLRRSHISWKFRRLRISDCLCLNVFLRISVSVRLKPSARMRRGDSLSGPTATRLLRMHRGRDDVMRLQRRKCNGTSIPRLSSLSLQQHSTFTRLASSALLPPTGRLFNINRIVVTDPINLGRNVFFFL